MCCKWYFIFASLKFDIKQILLWSPKFNRRKEFLLLWYSSSAAKFPFIINKLTWTVEFFSPLVIFHATSFYSILIDLYIGCSQKHLLISFHVSNVKTYSFRSAVSSNIVTLYAMLKDWAILPDHLSAYHNESEM